MDLNHLLHRHQTALIRGAASSSKARREASARTVADLGSAITRRQHELGATFSLVGCVR